MMPRREVVPLPDYPKKAYSVEKVYSCRTALAIPVPSNQLIDSALRTSLLAQNQCLSRHLSNPSRSPAAPPTSARATPTRERLTHDSSSPH
jgi:hypothetical protein